jgi:hypothetical protein
MKDRLMRVAVLAGVLVGCGALAQPPPFEERFPESFDGEPFLVEFRRAVDIFEVGIGLGIDDEQFAALGVAEDEVRLAAGPGPEIGGANDFSLTAYHFPGASEDRLAEVVSDSLAASAEHAPFERASRGGREGWSVMGAFYYVRHDALYLLSGDEALVDKFVAGIP